MDVCVSLCRPVVGPLRGSLRVLLAIALAAVAEAAAAAASPRGAADTWETLPLLPFTYGVSSGGGLATDGTYLYAADFSGDAGWDYIDLNGNLARDAGELLWELGIANASVRLARYDPAADTWEALPTLNPEGIGGNAFTEGNLVGPLFVAAGRLYYYLFQAGPNLASLYSYDLAAGTTGTWSTVWQKWESDAPLISAGAGLCAVAAGGQPVILHHIGGGAYDFVRTDHLADGGTHTRLTPLWNFTGAHFPRCGSWAYDPVGDRLYHLSGDQLVSWTHDEATYPGGSFLSSIPNGTQPLAVETMAIESLHTAFGWWTSSTAEHPGTSLWGNSVTLVSEASGIANGPGSEDTGDRVLYLVRGESTPDTWPFNEGRGTPYTQFGRYFIGSRATQNLPELPFAAGKGSCAAYVGGYLYVTQGDTLTVADDPDNVEPMNREGIRRPGRGLARFLIRPAPPADTTPPAVTAVTPSGTVTSAVDAMELTFSEPIPLAAAASLQVAESLIVDLRAEDLTGLGWPNHGSLGDLMPSGPPATVTLGGVLAVPLDTTRFLGAAPPATVTGSGDRTLEAWVYNPAIEADEETIAAWGRRGTDRENLALAYGSTWGAAHWGDDLTWAGEAVAGAPTEPPAAAAWHHLVYTYDGDTSVCLYVDGALRLRKTLAAPLATHPDGSLVLGAQNSGDGNVSLDEVGTLALARLRVHGGCLTAAQVAGNFAAEAPDFGLPAADLDAVLDLSDLELSGPLGPIALTGLEAVSETVFRIRFDSQSLDGDYTLTLHPRYADRAGNPPAGGDQAFIFTIAGMSPPSDLWRAWKGTFPAEAGHEQALGQAGGDPYLDLGAVAGDTCTLWPGLGDGTFASSDRAAEYSPFYSWPDSYTTLADVTGDGVGDLLYFEYQTNTLVVHVGMGNGRFGAVLSAFSLGQLAYEVLPADFNGDGLTDVAIRFSGGATMLVNTGSGSFTQAAMQAGYLASIAVASGIVPGRDSLLACQDSGTTKRVHILTLPASGPVDYRAVDVGTGPTAATLADLDGDGTADLAVACWQAQQVRLFRGAGTAFVAGQVIALGFQPIRLVPLPPRAGSLANLAVSDGRQLLLLRNDGAGTLAAGETCQFRCGDRLRVVDANGDAIPDLQGSQSFCFGDGTGGLRAPRPLALSAPCSRLAAADLDADTIHDLLALHTDAGTATVLLMGGQMAPRSTATLALGGQPRDLALAPLLGDPALDVAVIDGADGSLRVLPGNGDGTFGPETSIPVGADPRGLAVADLDGDGRNDLAVACRTDGEVWIVLAQADGSFVAQPPVAVAGGPAAIVTADIDGDGDQDLVVACATARSLQTLLGDGHGAFATGPATAVQYGQPTRLAVADVNRDGRPDVATLEGYGSQLYLGTGGGAFRAFDLDFGSWQTTATDVLFADPNRDGCPDLVTVCRWTYLEGGDEPGDACFIAYGNGRGGLLGTTVVQAGHGPACAAVLDLNRDGAADLAVGSLDASQVTLVPNLRAVTHSPHDGVPAPVQAIDLFFPQPMDTGSFDPAVDIASFSGPGGALAVTACEWPDASHLRLDFAAVSAPGVYRLVIGPDLRTAGGAALDLDGDGTPGEVPDDRYAASFRIPAGTPDPGTPVDVAWSGTVLATDSVRVPAGVRLTLAAGTVVKLRGGNTSLDVLGDLVVAGTVEAPVVFTSVNDDTGGAAPGSTGDPQPGDWSQIHLSHGAHAEIANARFRWGGGGTNVGLGGFLRVESRATATVRNCVFEHATYSGFVLWDDGTTVTVTNSVIRDCNFGVLADWYTVIDLGHCTLDANVVAIRGHGGTYNLTNCIVSNSIEAGIDDLGGPTVITLNHCDVWSPEGANYRNWPDQTGLDGNLALDPLYRDQPAGILALAYGSPLIDAADGTAATATDFYDQPRYDDPRSPNTGTPTNTGAFADLGAFEFVEGAPSDVDLVVTAVSGPAEAMVGDTVTVHWTVRNDGTAPARGATADRVYLAASDDRLIEVGTAPWTAALAAGASVPRQAELRLPPCVPGEWRFRVWTNVDREVFEGQNADNNTGTAADPVTIAVPALAPGAPLVVSLSAGPAVVALAAPADTALAVLLQGGDRNDVVFLGGLDRIPTQDRYDLAPVPWPGPELLLGVPPDATDRTLYLLVQRRTAALTEVTLQLYDNSLRLLAAGVPRASVTTPFTVPLLGCGFAAGMTVTLADEAGRGVVAADPVTVLSPWLAAARFDPGGLDLGAATLELASGEQSASLPGAMDLLPGGQGPRLSARLEVPSPVRPSRPYTLWLEYENTGDAEMPAPLFRIESYGTFELQCPGCGQWGLHPQYLVLGVNPFGPDPAVLPPGFRYRLPIAFKTLPGSEYRWGLSAREATDEPIDWDAMEAVIRPAIPPADWPLLFAELRDRLGNTWASYLAALHDQARRRFAAGIPIPCVERCFRSLANAPDYLVAGRLVLGGSGQGVAGVTMQLQLDADVAAVSLLSESRADGSFCFENVPMSGDVIVSGAGYLIAPEADAHVTITGADLAGLVLQAVPEPAEPEDAPLPCLPREFRSVLALADGSALVAWLEHGQARLARFDGTEWRDLDTPVPESEVIVEAQMVGLPAVTRSRGSPDVALTYVVGTGNESVVRRAWGQLQDGGTLAWSAPETLTGDGISDYCPQGLALDDGRVMTLWCQADASIDDDPDLYYAVAAVPEFLPEVLPPKSSTAAGEGTRDGGGWFSYQSPTIDIRVPTDVPFIGGHYRMTQHMVGALREADCEYSALLNVGGQLVLNAPDLPIRIKEVEANLTYRASFTVPEDACRYQFRVLKGEGHGVYDIDADPTLIKCLVKSGGTKAAIKLADKVRSVIGDLGGIAKFTENAAKWIKDNVEIGGTIGIRSEARVSDYALYGPSFPHWPNRGHVAGAFNTFAEAEFKAKVSRDDLKLIGTIKGEVGAGYVLDYPAVIPKVTPTGRITVSFQAAFMGYKTEPIPIAFPPLPTPKEGQETEPDELSDQLVFSLAAGTESVYEGTPVLAGTEHNTSTESEAAALVLPSGEVLACFSRYEVTDGAVRRVLYVTSFDGTTWAAPVRLDDGQTVCGQPALGVDGTGAPVIVFLVSPAATLRVDSPMVDVLDAYFRKDVFFVRRLAGVWTAPALVAHTESVDRDLSVVSLNDGTLAAAWVSVAEYPTLCVATYDGSGWSTPEVVTAAPDVVEPRLVAAVGGGLLAVWNQGVDRGLDTTVPRLFQAQRTAGVWSTPSEILPPGDAGSAAAKAATADAAMGTVALATRGTTRGLPSLPTPPAECCEDEEDDADESNDTEPDPPPPPPPPGPDGSGPNLVSLDPNDKDAPVGYGSVTGGRYVLPDQEFTFVIHFENLATAATAAQEVRIEDQLPAGMDWSSFALGGVGVGEQVRTDLEGLAAGVLTFHQESTGLDVRVEAQSNPATGAVSWYFRCIDPTSADAWPADPYAGFLPPNVNPPEGEGWVSYRLRPAAPLADGTLISGPRATITFDYNPPIETNATGHTVDASAPVSSVLGVQKTGLGNSVRLAVHVDDGAGAGLGRVELLTLSGERAAVLATALGEELLMTGAWGTTQDLYVRAVDGVGNAEPIPAEPSATVRIPQWAFRVGVSGDATDELFIGLDAGAGEGWDVGLDEDATAIGGASLAGPAGHAALRYDVRPLAAAVRWRVMVPAAGEGRGGTATLSWDPARVPVGKFLWWVRLDAAGVPVPDSFVDAAAVTSLTAAAGVWELTLADSPPLAATLGAGWNLLSLPVEPSAAGVGAIFGSRAAGGVAWTWGAGAGRDGGAAWTPSTELAFGQGVAVFAPAAGQVLVSGTAPVANAVTLQPGWNLVGVAAPCVLPVDPRLAPVAFLWVGDTHPPAYQAVDNLLPWNAYWLYWAGDQAAVVEFPEVGP